MQDYKDMYYLLFNKITDITNELQEVQRLAEEIFIMQSETDVTAIPQSPTEAK